MPYRVSKHGAESLDMTQTCPTRMLKIARNDANWHDKMAQNCSKVFKIVQSCLQLLKVAQNVSNYSKCLKMGQQVSIGVMCLHIQVRKLSLLGIAVAGVYCCMGLRSVSIEPRSCLLLRSEPSIVNFNWQGSLVIRLAAIVSINSLSRKKHHCFDRKTFMPAFSFVSLLPLDDTMWYHNQTWTSGIFCFLLRFERYRI